MKYVYKLLDETTLDLLDNKNVISFSRPFCHFKSEGKGFKVFRSMINRLNESASNSLLHTDKKLLNSTREWIDGYYDSLSSNIREEYSDSDIKSDLQIAMTIYFQIYCGYFTAENLDDESARNSFIKNNYKLYYNKVKYARIPITENSLDRIYWVSNKDEIYCFSCDSQQKDIESPECIRGSLHIHKVEYSNTQYLKHPYAVFNNTGNRRISSLLMYVDDEYCDQNEIRLMFRIPSYRPNQTVLGFNCQYPSICFNSLEEKMVYTISGICSEAKKYPQYVYLRINKYDIFDL